jgi:hypothetical protein
MNAFTNGCALLVVLSLTSALPLPGNSDLIFHSRSAQNIVPIEEGYDQSSASGLDATTIPELPLSPDDALDITSSGPDYTAFLLDSLPTSSDPPNFTGGSYSLTASADQSAPSLCQDSCSYTSPLTLSASDLPVLDSSENVFGEEQDWNGLSLPPNEASDSGSGPIWTEAHRGSGRNEKDDISSITKGKGAGERGSG